MYLNISCNQTHLYEISLRLISFSCLKGINHTCVYHAVTPNYAIAFCHLTAGSTKISIVCRIAGPQAMYGVVK